MSARYIEKGLKHKESSKLTVEFKPREIELLLMILSDAADSGMRFDGPPALSFEEMALAQKLEAALSKAQHEKDITDIRTFLGPLSEQKH